MPEKWSLVENFKLVLSIYVREVKWGNAPVCPSSSDIGSGRQEALF